MEQTAKKHLAPGILRCTQCQAQRELEPGEDTQKKLPACELCDGPTILVYR